MRDEILKTEYRSNPQLPDSNFQSKYTKINFKRIKLGNRVRLLKARKFESQRKLEE